MKKRKIKSFQEVLKYAESLGLQCSRRGNITRISAEHFDIALIVEEYAEARFFAAYRLRLSWHFVGESTDVNDVFGTLFALYLRSVGVASIRTGYEPHPAVPTMNEIYASFLIPSQPQGGYYESTENDLAEICLLIKCLPDLESLSHAVIANASNETHKEEREEEAAYVIDFAKLAARALFNKDVQTYDRHIYRSTPEWLYFKSSLDGSTVVVSARLALLTRMFLERGGELFEEPKDLEIGRLNGAQHETIEVTSINGTLFKGNSIENYVSKRSEARSRRILKKLGDEPACPVVPLDDMFCAIGRRHLLFLSHSSGAQAFRKEKEKLRERHQAEALLFSPESFVWAEKIDGERFEQLIYDLIQREPGVLRVRMAGPTNDRDGGRDLTVEWLRPASVGENPTQVRRFIVQCKARNRNVNIQDAGDIISTLYHYKANGYLLAVSRQITNSLTERLDEMRRRHDYDTEWWTRVEIEHRLKKHPDIVAKYRDIVRTAED